MCAAWLEVAFNSGAALTALIAAICWFISAAGKMPKEVVESWTTMFDAPRETIDALKYSAKWNRWAALFAGVSALLFGAAMALPLLSK